MLPAFAAVWTTHFWGNHQLQHVVAVEFGWDRTSSLFPYIVFTVSGAGAEDDHFSWGVLPVYNIAGWPAFWREMIVYNLFEISVLL